MPATTSHDVLTEALRAGAQRLLAEAVEGEVFGWIESQKHQIDTDGHRVLVRHGHMPTRRIVTSLGPVAVTQPRVRDHRIIGENEPGEPVDSDGQLIERFRSKILPPD